jgi:nitrate/TMAO reductase-like tetraheme cytochrome c subunit
MKPCSACHGLKTAEFSNSIHKDFECTSCHQIKKFPHEKVTSVNCVDCHTEIAKLYDKSVHADARTKLGLVVAPKCNDCHDAHNVKLHTDPKSIIYKTNIPQICGKCHVGIIEEYKNSIHGKALIENNNPDAPACTDCHGVHTITGPYKPESKVYPTNVPKTCATCHEVKTLMAKYKIKTEQVKTYRESFHGKSNIYGGLETANCASCHGFHNIKAIKNPQSQVSKQNLPQTCGKCHPGAINNPRFSESIMHLKPSAKVEPMVYYIQQFYIILIVLLISGMILHNIFDFFRRRKKT